MQVLPYAVIESAARELSDELSIVLSAIEEMDSSLKAPDRRSYLEAKRAAWMCAAKAEYLKLALHQGIQQGLKLPHSCTSLEKLTEGQ